MDGPVGSRNSAMDSGVASFDRSEAQKQLALRILKDLQIESKVQGRIILTEILTVLNSLPDERIQDALQHYEWEDQIQKKMEREILESPPRTLSEENPSDMSTWNEKVLEFLCTLNPESVQIEPRQIGILLREPSWVLRGFTIALLHERFEETQVSEALRDATPGVREAAIDFLHARMTLPQWIRALSDSHAVVRQMAYQAARRHPLHLRNTGVPDSLIEKSGRVERHPHPVSEILEAKS